jgi:hypothetical protein
VLAYLYADKKMGPSAKGARVSDPLTAASVLRAVEQPDETFRRPPNFKATPILEDEAKALELPDEPPWLFVFTGKNAPPPRGEPTRTVVGRVLLAGQAVAGARVRLGFRSGAVNPSLFRMADCLTDPLGGFVFSQVSTRPMFVAAAIEGYASRPVLVPDEGPMVIELRRTGRVEGELWRGGAPAEGMLHLNSPDGSLEPRAGSSDARGRFRLDGLVPGRYTLEAEVFNHERMTNGTPFFDSIEVGEGETLQRSYTLAVGVRLDIEIPSGDLGESDWVNVTLIAGHVSPGNHGEIRHWPRSSGLRHVEAAGLCADLPPRRPPGPAHPLRHAPVP